MIENDLEMLERGENAENESMATLRALQPWSCPRYSATDAGNGNLFADFFGDRARYMKEQKCWYVYDGKVWRPDESGLGTRALAKGLMELLCYYCNTLTDGAQRDVAFKQLERWHSLRGRTAILTDAQDVYPLAMDMLDANPMYLNCKNGTLDLDTLVLRPHQPGDLQSRMINTDYVRGVRCERWESFILEVMRRTGGQQSMEDETEAMQKAEWLKRMLGYALTGDTRLECMFMLHGATTRNGKSTLTETMLRLMGSYGAAIRPETLAARNEGHSASGPSEDLARLKGIRFVSASEPDRRMHFSGSLVKTLTGNDTVTARNLYQSSFQYHPEFKLFLNTNHLPSVDDQTLFQSGRVKVVPFERHFEPHEQDPFLKRLFAHPISLTGILNWCLDGLSKLQAEGWSLGTMPESARRSLAAYCADNDDVSRFAQECLVDGEGYAARASDVYRAYAEWCRHNGAQQDSAVAFRRQLSTHYKLGRGRLKGEKPTNVVFGCRLSP